MAQCDKRQGPENGPGVFLRGSSGSLSITSHASSSPTHDTSRNPDASPVEPDIEDNFQTVCNGTSEQQCDFGVLPSCLGHYDFRVRAELGGEESKWSKATFTPQEDTVIGPPNVTLVAKADVIEVTITDPVFKVLSLRQCYHEVLYSLKYWKADNQDDVAEKSDVAQQQVRLRFLEPDTSYCVQAAVTITSYVRTGQYSDPACAMTSATGTLTALTAASGEKRKLVVSLVAVAVALPLVLLTAWFIYKGRRLYNPKVNLPPYFKKHLLEGSCASVISALQATSLQEQYDKISCLHEEYPYHDITHQNGAYLNIDNRKDGEEYCNVLAASEMPYRNIEDMYQ
ncbi:interleukin-10 receptor subunit beta-like [Polymixia lowei]